MRKIMMVGVMLGGILGGCKEKPADNPNPPQPKTEEIQSKEGVETRTTAPM